MRYRPPTYLHEVAPVWYSVKCMSVHEVVTQAVDYVNGNLITDLPMDNATFFAAYEKKIANGGAWSDHSALLEPPSGRQPSIQERVGPYDVTLKHPNRAIASDLRVGLLEPVRGLCFRDPCGLEVSPIDLCLRLCERSKWHASVYVASQGNLYAVQTVDTDLVLDRSRRQKRIDTVDISEIGDQEALKVAFYAVKAVIRTPVSVRGIKRDRWKMQSVMDQGAAGPELREAEKTLWKIAQTMESTAPEPPETHPLFPGARKIGYGYEWVAYLLPDGKTVAKVPRGVFPEIAEPGYLFAAKDTYDACKTFIPRFTADTEFERRDDTNILFQEFLAGDRIRGLDPAKLSSQQRSSFRDFGEGLMKMLEQHDWSPDLWLQRTEHGLWHMINVITVGDAPILYDFTAVYDDYRLSPERTREETVNMKSLLATLIDDMS